MNVCCFPAWFSADSPIRRSGMVNAKKSESFSGGELDACGILGRFAQSEGEFRGEAELL